MIQRSYSPGFGFSPREITVASMFFFRWHGAQARQVVRSDPPDRLLCGLPMTTAAPAGSATALNPPNSSPGTQAHAAKLKATKIKPSAAPASLQAMQARTETPLAQAEADAGH